MGGIVSAVMWVFGEVVGGFISFVGWAATTLFHPRVWNLPEGKGLLWKYIGFHFEWSAEIFLR